MEAFVERHFGTGSSVASVVRSFLSNPISDASLLRRRRRALVGAPPAPLPVRDEGSEELVIQMQDHIESGAFKQALFEEPFLNRHPLILGAANTHSVVISPAIACLVIPIAYIVAPLVILHRRFHIRLSPVAYARLLFNMYMAGGDVLSLSVGPTAAVTAQWLTFAAVLAVFASNIKTALGHAKEVVQATRSALKCTAALRDLAEGSEVLAGALSWSRDDDLAWGIGDPYDLIDLPSSVSCKARPGDPRVGAALSFASRADSERVASTLRRFAVLQMVGRVRQEVDAGTLTICQVCDPGIWIGYAARGIRGKEGVFDVALRLDRPGECVSDAEALAVAIVSSHSLVCAEAKAAAFSPCEEIVVKLHDHKNDIHSRLHDVADVLRAMRGNSILILGDEFGRCPAVDRAEIVRMADEAPRSCRAVQNPGRSSKTLVPDRLASAGLS